MYSLRSRCLCAFPKKRAQKNHRRLLRILEYALNKTLMADSGLLFGRISSHTVIFRVPVTPLHINYTRIRVLSRIFRLGEKLRVAKGHELLGGSGCMPPPPENFLNRYVLRFNLVYFECIFWLQICPCCQYSINSFNGNLACSYSTPCSLSYSVLGHGMLTSCTLT